MKINTGNLSNDSQYLHSKNLTNSRTRASEIHTSINFVMIYLINVVCALTHRYSLTLHLRRLHDKNRGTKRTRAREEAVCTLQRHVEYAAQDCGDRCSSSFEPVADSSRYSKYIENYLKLNQVTQVRDT